MKVGAVLVGLILILGLLACNRTQKVSAEKPQLEMLTYRGIYQGKNLFIQNPFHSTNPNAPNPVGAQKYWINGDLICNFQAKERTCDWSSAFEVTFEKTRLRIGDSVRVRIAYYPASKPKCLNPSVLLPMSTFQVKELKLHKSGKLDWTVWGETGKLPFEVEQYRWGRWIKVGEVLGEGTPVDHNYSLNVASHLHSGKNQFRIGQTGHTGKPRRSHVVEVKSEIPEVTVDGLKEKKNIRFNSTTRYEVYDAHRNLVLKGEGTGVELSTLKKGAYQLCYDNKQEKFIKQ